VVSRTMRGISLPNTQIISENLVDEITKLKQGSGRDIVIFGSPTTAHALMDHNLIDDYWLFVNPVLLGHGIPLFKGIESKIMLALISCDIVSPGIVCLHYKSKSEYQAHAGG
jgi:dihydrofolate reductase